MRKQRRALMAAAVVGAFFAYTFAATPGISTAATAVDDATALGYEPADIASLAENLGISYEEGVAQYGGQSAFLSVLTLAQEVAPETFVAAEWLPTGSVHGWISFTDAPPAEVSKAIAQLPFRISIRTDAVQSARDADQSLAKAHDFVMSLGDENVDMGFNTELDSLTVSFERQLSPEQAELLIAALQPYLLPGVSLKITTSADTGVEFQSIRGGQGMTWTGGICTSGFTARRGATWGVITAGHCNVANTTLDGSASLTTNVTGATGSGGDARYYSSPDTVRLNSIHIANSGTLYRTITSKTTIPVGGSVCVYGIQHSAFWCTTVTAVNQYYGAVCKQNKTNTGSTVTGDSGGPWFWNNSAVGTHTGLNSSKAIYTLIASAETLVGGAVYLG